MITIDFNRDFYLGHPPSSISNYFISFRPQIQTTFDKDSMEIILLQIILELIFRNHVGLGGVPRGNTTINRKILLKTALIMILLLTLTLKENGPSLIWLRVKMSENDLAQVKNARKFSRARWFRCFWDFLNSKFSSNILKYWHHRKYLTFRTRVNFRTFLDPDQFSDIFVLMKQKNLEYLKICHFRL